MNKAAEEILTHTKDQRNLLMLLKETQDRFGYLPREIIVELANFLDIPVSEVYGVATFYSFLSTKPQGRHVIKICKSLPCLLNNAQVIIDTVEQELGIKPGETTPDDKFSFQLINCIGACDKPPAMLINDNVYNDLTPEKISQILKVCE